MPMKRILMAGLAVAAATSTGATTTTSGDQVFAAHRNKTMNILKTIAAASALAAIATPALAAPYDWREIGLNDSGSDRWYYDANSIQRYPGSVSVFVNDTKANGEFNNGTMEFNCQRMTLRLLGSTSYSANAQFLRSYPAGEWIWIGKGTIGEAIMHAVC
jgi:hypothetical protein